MVPAILTSSFSLYQNYSNPTQSKKKLMMDFFWEPHFLQNYKSKAPLRESKGSIMLS